MADFLQLLQAKSEAEQATAAALRKFTEVTEHRVSGVSISKLDNIEAILDYKIYQVELEVRAV